jgi:predicted HD superfamily hydrolase involved in NAD metabolism
MMNIDDIKSRLQMMLSQKRFSHSTHVMEASRILAEKYGEDIGKAELAGLIHDCAKDMDKSSTFALCKKYDIIVDSIMKKQPEILHGMVGAFLARDLFEVDDKSVLAAVTNHTMGCENMNKLSSIVFIADYIEAGRSYEGVEKIRKAAESSLEEAIVAGVDSTIEDILKKGKLLHPQIVLTRNWALEQLKGRTVGLL